MIKLRIKWNETLRQKFIDEMYPLGIYAGSANAASGIFLELDGDLRVYIFFSG